MDSPCGNSPISPGSDWLPSLPELLDGGGGGLGVLGELLPEELGGGGDELGGDELGGDGGAELGVDGGVGGV